jgi:hypothetical protein
LSAIGISIACIGSLSYALMTFFQEVQQGFHSLLNLIQLTGLPVST